MFVLKITSPTINIYGKQDQSIFYTQDVLKGKETLTEEDFLKLGEEYFKMMSKDIYDISLDLYDHLCKLNFEDINEVKLIDTQYPTNELFIEIDAQATQVWKDYLEVLKENEPISRKYMLDDIKKDLYNYMISVPLKHSFNQQDDKNSIIFINKEQISTTYDIETGFIRSDPEQLVI